MVVDRVWAILTTSAAHSTHHCVDKGQAHIHGHIPADSQAYAYMICLRENTPSIYAIYAIYAWHESAASPYQSPEIDLRPPHSTLRVFSGADVYDCDGYEEVPG